MKRCIICLFFVALNATAQPLISKIIQLHYLSADEALQLIQPLINQEERASGSGQTLVLKVSLNSLTNIRSLLQKVDIPPVIFKVTVYQGDSNWLNEQKDEIYSTSLEYQSPSTQSVTVMNGQMALVSMDNQVPMVRAIGIGYPGVIYQQYHVQTGLMVRPVQQGSHVKLFVSRLRQEQNVLRGQQIAAQQMDTVVMAPINKWVYLGTTNGTDVHETSTTTYSTHSAFIKNSTLYIKVSTVGDVLKSQ